MEDSFKNRILHEAKELWNTGRALEAGRLIFERIPPDYRTEWATSVLEVAYSRFTASPEIDAVLEFARDPGILSREGKWREAHDIVDNVNCFPYLLPMPFSQTIFELATNVGKVIYNANGYPIPFDYDAGWEIADILKQIVQGIDDAEFEARAWSALCNEKFIKLKASLLYSLLAGNITFPFKVRCIVEYSPSLSKEEDLEVVKMASEEDCLHEILVEIHWSGKTLTVPLSQIEPIEADDKTREAIFFYKNCSRHYQ